uniref:Uncharacterized protein n=1 Tax=Chromera velia CCMP2878 TaxID=1169474 RepID=A0A0G4I3U6_9ALVE|eukprot:Cvel_1756.t1-p1 / transcript=Cvel_1756.t1 / gene=Cvel_1756 / organism=Chromera_velia_CCMP2878 / gene_product=Protein NLRC3, putative / transcript_product=Protein NLRC3, putative / location=Cvel_scaffold64:69848-73897(-) / protein_length=716 / sequence_SO=supercontig / SO=protein_coding / is_pseudo=false
MQQPEPSAQGGVLGTEAGGDGVTDLHEQQRHREGPNSAEALLCALLCALLKHAGPTAQLVSELTASRDSFGVAWVVAWLLKRARPGLVLEGLLDISECQVSPGKLGLLLSALPLSVQELQVGPAAISEAAVPLLCRFLKGEGGTSQGRRALKDLVFAGKGKSCAEAAEALFASLPDCLENLKFQGVLLARGAMSALAHCLKETVGPCLLSLSFIESSEKEGLGVFFAAMRETENQKEGPFKSLEELCVEDSWVGVNPSGPSFRGVCDALCPEVLPSLRRLRVGTWEQFCGSSGQNFVARLVESKFPLLESLNLKDSYLPPEAARDLSQALSSGVFPSLRELNLIGCVIEKEGAEALLKTLSEKDAENQSCPLEAVDVSLRVLNDSSIALLGDGKVMFLLRDLEMEIHPLQAVSFLQSLEKPGSVKRLSLTVAWSIMHDAPQSPGVGEVLAGSLHGPVSLASCLHELSLKGGEMSGHLGREERTALFESFRASPLPLLTVLELSGHQLKDADMTLFSDAVKAGNLPLLKRLNFRQNDFGKAGTDALMEGIREKGLLVLKELNLSSTQAGEGAESLAQTLAAGKLPLLQRLVLVECGLTDEGLIALGGIFPQTNLPSLVSLQLSENLISPHGLRSFLGSLTPKSLPRLERLLHDVPHGGERELREAHSQGKFPSMPLLPNIETVDEDDETLFNSSTLGVPFSFPPEFSFNLAFQFTER